MTYEISLVSAVTMSSVGVSESFVNQVIYVLCRACLTTRRLLIPILILLKRSWPEKWRTNTVQSGAFLKKVKFNCISYHILCKLFLMLLLCVNVIC